MGFFPPSYGGDSMFGYAVKMKMVVNPTAEQLNQFFGISGSQSLYGGTRGRTFLVDGLFAAEDLDTLNAYEGNFLSYLDGIARTMVDTRGRAWANVLLRQLEPGEKILHDQRGLYLPYKAMFNGLT
ncbi:hypothetical protein [Singulisphaera sp. PoT]|uniref:hypothetical protein n=1 Tax=Singulisphaera sp. PoT TaxID=3411797 RepID=UPI003BF4D2A3